MGGVDEDAFAPYTEGNRPFGERLDRAGDVCDDVLVRRPMRVGAWSEAARVLQTSPTSNSAATSASYGSAPAQVSLSRSAPRRQSSRATR